MNHQPTADEVTRRLAEIMPEVVGILVDAAAVVTEHDSMPRPDNDIDPEVSALFDGVDMLRMYLDLVGDPSVQAELAQVAGSGWLQTHPSRT